MAAGVGGAGSPTGTGGGGETGGTSRTVMGGDGTSRMVIGFGFDCGIGAGGSVAGALAGAEPLAGSRNSHEAKPRRLVSPALEIAHQVTSEPNTTSPITTVSPRLSLHRTSADSDIDAYTGSVSLLTTARAPAATVCACAATAASARHRACEIAGFIIYVCLPALYRDTCECVEMV